MKSFSCLFPRDLGIYSFFDKISEGLQVFLKCIFILCLFFQLHFTIHLNLSFYSTSYCTDVTLCSVSVRVFVYF